MAEYLIQDSTLTDIANAVRTKTGKTGSITPSQMASELNAIQNKDSSSLTVSGATVTVPAGNYKSAASKSVATATQATPSISIDSAGKITASATQTAGYVAAGTKSGTKQMTVKAATTWTPKTSNQTIASGTYLTGTQTIKGDSNLKAANIKKGVSIFGVAGSADDLNLTIVGGTSQPSSPAANTIWVNTSTSINGWAVSLTAPSSPASGMVWIVPGTMKNTGINVSLNKTLNVYTHNCYQYVSGSWVTKTAKTYKNGSWVSWILYAYNRGDICQDVSGGWGKTEGNGTLTLESTQMRFDGSWPPTKVRSGGTIDVTAFSQMVIVGCNNSTHETRISFQNSGLIPANDSSTTAAVWTNNILGDFTMKVDISALQGHYYILLQTGGAWECDGVIYEVYFE